MPTLVTTGYSLTNREYKYGGANSHMAIRCAEFSIPAAIGCGEQRFDAFMQARQLSLDCSAGLIIPLH